MGRVARYKKVKRFEPYSTDTTAFSDTNTAEAPKTSKQVVPRKLKLLAEAQATGKPRKARKESLPDAERDGATPQQIQARKDREVKASIVSGLVRKRGETLKQFERRVDREAATVVAQQARRVTATAERKRAFHKAKKEKEREKRKEAQMEEDNTLSRRDHVRFGEVVSAPPTLASKPRMKIAPKRAPLLLEAGVKKASKSSKDKPTSSPPVAPARVAMLEAERQRAIDAYRMLKARKIHNFPDIST
eukprot:m.47316 g.47316  ORF g.47316 m.47316 type:complete len:247 (+) comp6350_c0_seq2:44-784(+)